jgi:hypothetical protein
MKQLLLIVALAALWLPSSGRQAAASLEPLCFPNVPGITNCIDAQLRAYWEQQGGLPVFGYPIGPAAKRAAEGGAFLTQDFERNRLEAHPENQAPYHVLLGRLGVDRLEALGRGLPKHGSAGRRPDASGSRRRGTMSVTRNRAWASRATGAGTACATRN